MKSPAFTCLTILALILVSTAAAASAGPQDTPPMLPADLDNLQYIPDDVLMGPDETVYLLSRANKAVFRWSVSQRAYIETISLAEAPERMAYSPTTNRLYLGYISRVTQVKLGESLAEQPYITLDGELFGLAMADEFAFVYSHDALMPFYHTHHPDGTPLSEKFPGEDSDAYTWSTSNRRMYHFVESAPNRVYWDYIDATGVLSGSQQSPSYPSAGIAHPIRVAPDGSDVVLGSGWVYDAISLEHTHSLSNTIADAAWAGGSMFALHDAGGVTEIQKWDAEYGLQATKRLDGMPVRVLAVSEGLLVITHLFDVPLFWILDLDFDVIYRSPFHVSFLPTACHYFCPDLRDDFSDPESGWPVGENSYVRAEYLDGEYRVLSKREGYLYLFAAPTCARRDYTVQVDMRWVGTADSSYGLVFDLSEDLNYYYLFDIRVHDGWVRLYDHNPTGFYLVSERPISEFKPGEASNHIELTYSGTFAALSVNGWHQAYWWQLPRHTIWGRVGLASTRYIGLPASDVRFDNFSVVALRGGGMEGQGAGEADAPACKGQAPSMWMVPVDDLGW